MRVLVSGYYGFGNLGDEALLAGMLTGLHGHSVTVLSQHPAATRALHGVGAVHRLRGLTALLNHDALVSGGGGLLQDKTSARSLRYYLGVLELAKRLGKRTVVYGQSVGPLSPDGERAVVRALRGLPVAVRDRPSQAWLRRLGISAELVADSALLLPKPEPTDAALSPAPVLLIPRGGLPSVTEALATLATRLEAEGVAVAGLALQPNEDDEPLEQLSRAAPTLQKLSATTPQQALEQITRSRHIVSARLHGLILAARAGVPFSGVAYDPKVAAFLTETGNPVHPVPPDPQALLDEVFNPVFGAAKVAALTTRAQIGQLWLREVLGR